MISNEVDPHGCAFKQSNLSENSHQYHRSIVSYNKEDISHQNDIWLCRGGTFSSDVYRKL